MSLVSGFGAYVAASHGLFLFGSTWQIPLFVGCVVGLVALSVIQGAATAGVVMLVGSVALTPPALPPGAVSQFRFAMYLLAPSGPSPASMGIPAIIGCVLASMVAAAGIAYLRTALTAATERRSVNLAVAVLLVGWVIGNLWVPLLVSGPGGGGYGALEARTVNEIPQPGQYVYDDALYRRVRYLMQSGEPYYAAYGDAWRGLKARPELPNSIAAIRLPTIFWVWRILPQAPFSIVYLYLVVCTLGVVASAFIAGQMVGTRFSPLAAAALAAYVLTVGGTVYSTYVDLPAACVSLVGVALFVRSRLVGSRRTLWAAACLLALAAVTREILVYLPLLAAFSSLLEEKGSRLKAAIPWLSSMGAFVVVYVAHWIAARPILNMDSDGLSYWRGSAAFALRGLTSYAMAFNGGGAVLVVLFVLGIAGAFAVHRRLGWPFSAFGVAALVLPVLAMVRAGNPGIDVDGNPVNYWGLMILPLALSFWPAWALLMQGKRQS